MPLGKIKTEVTHSHYCKHCDESWACVECLDPDTYEVKRHGCEPQQQYRVRMAVIMAMSLRPCRYGCTGECNHDRAGAKMIRSCDSGSCGECKTCRKYLKLWEG